MNAGFSRLQAAVRANPRLRWGLWLIAGILWFYAVLLLRDEAGARRLAVENLSKRAARAQSLAGEADWPARLRSAQAVQQNLESRLWQAGTLGLAQAAFQDWLNQAARQAGLSRPVITVAAPEESPANRPPASAPGVPPPDLWKATARLRFDFDPAALYRLLAQIESHEKMLSVESLTMRSAPTPGAEIVVVAYFQKPAALQPGLAGAARPAGS
jgi:hypothetical protein